jgi:hypothetical protein
MLLDYYAGEDVRHEIMSNAPTARRVYNANNGIAWETDQGRQVERELHLAEVQLRNQRSAWFSTEDIMLGLQEHGPLMFSGAFVRFARTRWYRFSHVIVVHGVEYDKVWYHDPQPGMESFEADQVLEWSVFKNYQKARRASLNVHALVKAGVARIKAEVARARGVADLHKHLGTMVSEGWIDEFAADELKNRHQ